MGNCMDLFFSPPQEKIRVLIFNGGEELFNASTTVDQIICGPYHDYTLVHHGEPASPLPRNGKLVSGEIYYLVPFIGPRFDPPESLKMDGRDCSDGLVKIKVTKRQLEEWILGNGAKEFRPDEFALRVIESCQIGESCRRWRPSLATVPEMCTC